MNKKTQELLELLKKAPNIKSFIEKNKTDFVTADLCGLLEQLLIQKNVTKSQCIADANIQRNYGYQIFSGERVPSRDKLLCICLALHLNIEETHRLLCSCGYADLYAKNKRDSIFLFALNNKLSVLETNDLLYEMEENILV